MVTIIVRENVQRSKFRLQGKSAVCLSGPIWTRRRFRLNRCGERFDQNKFSSRNFTTQESLYLAQKAFPGNLVWLLDQIWFFWFNHFQHFIYTFFPLDTKDDLPNPISNPDLKINFVVERTQKALPQILTAIFDFKHYFWSLFLVKLCLALPQILT